MQALLFFLLAVVFCAPVPSVTRRVGNLTISETKIKGDRIDDYQVHYIDDTKVVFLRVLPSQRSDGGDLYRSSDEGLSWTLQSIPSIMPGADANGISRMFSAKALDGRVTMYFLGAYGDGKLWVSQDSGASYQLVSDVPRGIYFMYMHDMFPGTALARAGTPGDVTSQVHAVYYVSEFGSKWEKIADVPVSSHIEWSRISKVNPNRIYLQNSTAAANRFSSRLVYSDDFFKTYTTLGPQNVLSWQIVPPNRLVVTTCQDTKSCINKELQISEDGGATFKVITFPDRSHEVQDETNFFVWEVTDDTVWVNVERDCAPRGQVCSGDLFHSHGVDDGEFTLSLEDHRRWDFTKYNSLNGIYIANQYHTYPETDVRSLITFNKGSTWDLLKAPDFDSRQQPTNCKRADGCGLHLHGWADNDFDYFYSVPNAVGIMLASGNTGKRLENRAADVNMYYSRNGGLDWQEVRSGQWITEIGDHGSVVVAAPIAKSTSSIIYTVTDGDEWHEVNLGTQPFLVSNIRVDVGWDSKQFIVYGSRIVNGETEAVILHLNFDDAYPKKQCQESTDYEPWSPTSEHGKCFMGAKTTYNRRKFGVGCYYGPQHKIETSTVSCSCTSEDYECSHCFFMPAMGESCRRECGHQDPPSSEQCPSASGFFEIDGGMELIDGNKCNPNDGWKPKAMVSCDYKDTDQRPNTRSGGRVWLILLAGAALWVCIGAVCVFLWKNNETFRTFVGNTFGIASANHYTQGESLADSDSEALTPDGVVNSDDVLKSSSSSE